MEKIIGRVISKITIHSNCIEYTLFMQIAAKHVKSIQVESISENKIF